MQWKHRELTQEELKKIESLTKDHAFRSRHTIDKNIHQAKGKLTCNSYPLCQMMFDVKNKKAHLNRHLNRNFDTTPYFDNLYKIKCGDKEFIQNVLELESAFMNCESVTKSYKSDKFTKEFNQRIIYVIKLVDNFHSSYQSSIKKLNSPNKKVQFSSKMSKVERNPKLLFNSIVYIGMSDLISEDESRPLYKLLYIYLIIELKLPIVDLDDNLLLIYNHLKDRSSISIQTLCLESNKLQILLLEKAFITIGFPNLSNRKYGDIDWNGIDNVCINLLKIRCHFLQTIAKKEEIVLTYDDLDLMFSHIVPFAKATVNHLGPCKNINSLERFLTAKVLTIANDNLVTSYTFNHSISLLKPEPSIKPEDTKCDFKECQKLVDLGTVAYYQHLCEHQLNSKMDSICCCCGTKLKSKKGVGKHLRRVHARIYISNIQDIEDKIIKCALDSCEKLFNLGTVEYYDHLLEHYRDKVLENPKTILDCCFCGKNYLYSSGLTYHIRDNHARYNPIAIGGQTKRYWSTKPKNGHLDLINLTNKQVNISIDYLY